MNDKKDWNYIYKKNKSALNHSKNRLSSIIREYFFNKIAYAFMSALFLGVMFGMILLQLVEQDTLQPVKQKSVTSDKVENQVDKQQGTSTSKLETVSFQVIQTGVFQNEKNAKDWVNKHATKELPFFIWERDEQYYVLTNPFITTVDQNVLDLLSDLGVDAFVKEWQVEKEVSKLSDKDIAKLHTFIELWKQSLSTGEQQHSLTKEWKEWIEPSQKESATILAFQEKVQAILYENSTGKSLSKQQLLELLFSFEQTNFSHDL